MEKEFKRHLNKALLVAIFFLLIFSVIPLDWHRTGDFNFHFEKAGERCTDVFEKVRCDSYYPLLHFMGRFFSFSPLAFSNFLMVIVIFITPLILFFITRNWITVWFYFSVTQYVYLIQTGGAYPQALAGIFLLIFIYTKSSYLRIPILLVATLAHSQAFVLLLFVWFIELFFKNFKSIKTFFPACSAIFGRTAEDPIGQRVSLEVLNKHGLQLIHIPIKDIANFFIRIFPLPFLIMAFWQLKKEKNWALIVVTLFVVYYGIAVGQARIFLIVPLILLPTLTNFYSGLDKRWKRWFIVLTIVTFTVNFGTWLLFKVNCV